MKQTLYEKIKTVVESWHIAITQDKNWNNRLWSSTWEWWIIRVSNSFDDLNYCYYSLWFHYYHRFEIEEIEKKWECYIWIYERPLWRPEVWDEVMLLKKAEGVKEMYGKTKDEYRYKDFIGNKCEVHLLGDYFCQIRIPSEWLFRVPYDCIVPWVEIDEE